MSRSRWSAVLSIALAAVLVPGVLGALGEDLPASPAGQSLPPPSQSPPLTVAGPQYGMHLFVWDAPDTRTRDLQRVVDLGFNWQKTLFQWRLIETNKGVYNWAEAERIVKASNDAGIRVLARVDFQPMWARADRAHNGPPDRYSDFGDFIFALVDHFKPGSPHGTISGVELWNEPNLWRDWGNQTIGPQAAADYVRLLCVGHQVAKRANPEIITVTAGLTPTGTISAEAADDTVFLQWMYDAGAKPCFDALGAHAAGFKAPPWIGPTELASNPAWGGHASFGFRRVEQLRDVMVRNGDAAKQVWLTEFGWTSDPVNPSYSWHRVTEEEKASYVVEAFRWAYNHWQPWIGVMILWNIPAPEWPSSREEYWWGIMNPDGSARPAYNALIEARRTGYLPMGTKEGEAPDKPLALPLAAGQERPPAPAEGDSIAGARFDPSSDASAAPASAPSAPSAITAPEPPPVRADPAGAPPAPRLPLSWPAR